MSSNRPLRFAVSIVAIVIAALHFWRPDVKIDSTTLLLVVVALLPWMQPLFKSIELLGVKLELQELHDKISEAKGAAESASQQADLALSVSSVPASTSASSAVTGDIAALAKEYNNIRETQSSSDSRTAAMTDVVRRMIDSARKLGSFELDEALKSDDRGRRLSAYAFLYTKPNPEHLSPLVQSVTKREDRPFGQYWGLQAIARALDENTTMADSDVRQLRQFSASLQPGTDRDYELRRILQRLKTH